MSQIEVYQKEFSQCIHFISSKLSMNVPIGSQLQAELGKTIQYILRQKCAQIFSQPVDYVKLGILDYPEIIRKPMDLSTLRNKLQKGEYRMLSDFLQDAHLIFENCRIYNGNSADGMYTDLAQECEDMLIQQLTRISCIQFVHEDYYTLISNDKDKEIRIMFSIQKIQNLVLKMSQLRIQDLQTCIAWYCQAKGIPFKNEDLAVIFNTFDGKILQQLDRKVDQLLNVKNKR